MWRSNWTQFFFVKNQNYNFTDLSNCVLIIFIDISLIRNSFKLYTVFFYIFLKLYTVFLWTTTEENRIKYKTAIIFPNSNEIYPKLFRPKISMGLVKFPQAHTTNQPSRASNDNSRENRWNDPVNFGFTEVVSRQAEFLSGHVHRYSNGTLYPALFRKRRWLRYGGDESNLRREWCNRYHRS